MGEAGFSNTRKADQTHHLAGLCQFVAELVDGKDDWLCSRIAVRAEVQAKFVIEQVLGIYILGGAAPWTIRAPTNKSPAHFLLDPRDESGVPSYPGSQTGAVIEVSVESIRISYVDKRFAQCSSAAAKGAVGSRSCGTDNYVGARLVREFLNDGTDRP